MTKEEKIKESWGIHFSSDVDENGYITYTEYQDIHLLQWVGDFWEKGFNKVLRIYWVRPKSLQGIENNNGWIKIESEKDLPKEKGLKCLFLCIHGNTTYISDDVLEDPKWFADKYSHWRLKVEIKDPIY